MKPYHHLDEATLLARAAGTLPAPLAMVADCHLEYCPSCRAAMKQACEIGGALLNEQQPAEVSASCKDAVLNRIGSATVHRLPVPAQGKRGDVPLALQNVLKFHSFDDIPWRKAAPGVQTYKLPKLAEDEGFFGLLRIAPGAKLPEHGHGGTELTLVLKGAYQDELGHFGRGDIADHDESIEHTPVVTGEEACICLVATHAATRFRSWPARLVQRFVGI